jgi:predicted nucleotidyltransferase
VDGERVIAEAAESYVQALGDRLLAAYALGSLAHGGFSPLVSDIDLGLIVRDPIEPDDAGTIQAIADAERRKGSDLHRRLSVFWGTPLALRGEIEGGRFPPLDRLDLIEHGLLLAGDDHVRRELPRPDTTELLTTGARFALENLAGIRRTAAAPSPPARLGSMPPASENAAREILSPELLLAHGVRHTTKLVLFPVRFMYTVATGSVGTNAAAVTHYLADLTAPAKPLVAAALRWREAPPDDPAVAKALLAENMLALYLHYIDDHIERLGSIRATDLASAFQDWRDQLDR